MSTASECLFSLVNGDDIFTTFATINDVNMVIWWYSRVYLYVFISLFIYVILSVFISVIMDTYETLKVRTLILGVCGKTLDSSVSVFRLASSLKLAARCPVSGCWPSCFFFIKNRTKTIPNGFCSFLGEGKWNGTESQKSIPQTATPPVI